MTENTNDKLHAIEKKTMDRIIDKHYQRKHGPNAYYGQGKK